MSTFEKNCSWDSKSDDKLVVRKGRHFTPRNFFRFKPKDDAQRVIICEQRFCIIAAQQVNTVNLCEHLQHHHKIQYELAMKDKGTTSKNPSLQSSTSLEVIPVESPVWLARFFSFLLMCNKCFCRKNENPVKNRDFNSQGEKS